MVVCGAFSVHSTHVMGPAGGMWGICMCPINHHSFYALKLLLLIYAVQNEAKHNLVTHKENSHYIPVCRSLYSSQMAPAVVTALYTMSHNPVQGHIATYQQRHIVSTSWPSCHTC